MNEAKNTTRPLEVVLPITVRTYDIDMAGIVNNIVYVRWLEDLRLRMLEVYCPLDGLLAGGIVPVLQKTVIEYRRPVRLFDAVEGRLWMSRYESPHWTSSAEILVNGKTAALAEQSGVFINIATMKPAPMPERLQKLYEEAGRVPA